MRCLVIEDDISTSRYICNGLQQAGYETTPSYSGFDGLERAAAEVWDIVILDRLLPGQMDGISIVRKLREQGNNTPVLILSALSSVDERVRGLRSGGDDYLSKPFAFPELLARVEVLLRRPVSSGETAQMQIADLVIDKLAMRVTRGSRVISLQPREFRLLEYLMRHAGKVVTRTMLLEAVWDYHFDPQTNVIDVQISRLRNKIDKDFSPVLIHTLRGTGYVLSADSPAADA